LVATTLHYCSNLAASLVVWQQLTWLHFIEYACFYSVIIGMAYAIMKKKNSHTTKDDLQGRADDNQNVLLDLAILRYWYFIYPSVLYVLVAYHWKRINWYYGWKVCADVVFYFLTIVNYEWMKSKNHFLSWNYQ
jgi:hypothetical protein